MTEIDQFVAVQPWKKLRFARKTIAELKVYGVDWLRIVFYILCFTRGVCRRKDVVFALETLELGMTGYVLAEDGLYRIARERNYTLSGPIEPEELAFRTEDVWVFLEKE